VLYKTYLMSFEQSCIVRFFGLPRLKCDVPRFGPPKLATTDILGSPYIQLAYVSLTLYISTYPKVQA
jgi:hypothetical protein